MILSLGSLVLGAFLGAGWQETQDAPAEEVPPILELPCDWEAGTRYDLVLRRERVDHEKGVLKKRQASTTPIAVEVIERTETGYRVRWTFGNTKIDGVDGAEAIVGDIAALTRGVVLEFSTDERGSVERLTNREEARAEVEKKRAIVESQWRVTKKSPERLELVLAEWKRHLDGSAFDGAMLREATIFYFPSGGSFALRTEQTYETQLPNPLGGDPLPAKGCFLFEDFDVDVDVAIVVWTQVLDPERSAAILEETIAKLARRLGDKPPDLKFSDVSIADRVRFDYCMSTGIPRKVEYVRTIVMNDIRRVDSFVIDVTTPKAAR